MQRVKLIRTLSNAKESCRKSKCDSDPEDPSSSAGARSAPYTTTRHRSASKPLLSLCRGQCLSPPGVFVGGHKQRTDTENCGSTPTRRFVSVKSQAFHVLFTSRLILHRPFSLLLPSSPSGTHRHASRGGAGPQLGPCPVARSHISAASRCADVSLCDAANRLLACSSSPTPSCPSSQCC